LFLIFALVQSVFGASLATVKGMEIAAVALGAFGLFRLLSIHGSKRAAVWAAALFPIYTLTFGGTTAVNMLLLSPFVIAAFAAAMNALDGDAPPASRLRGALLAGLAIGAAGMIRQTAIFEAGAIFLALLLWGERARLAQLVTLYVAGAAVPTVAFAAYFLAAGHFHEMFEAVIVLAQQRNSDDVLQLYGPALAFYVTIPGALVNTVLSAAPTIFLWGAVLFLVLRLRLVRQSFPGRVLALAAIWLAAAIAGVVASRNLNGYDLMPSIPPLLMLSGALIGHGLDVAPRRASLAAVITAVVAVASLAFIGRDGLFAPGRFGAGDHAATHKLSETIRSLSSGRDDRLLVINRGLAVFTETGLFPPTPWFHPTQLLGAVHTSSNDPLGAALDANPRFIVIADPTLWDITERRSQLDRALAYVAAHYRVAAEVDGAKDSFTLYEYAGS